jgi:hypothetical protein
MGNDTDDDADDYVDDDADDYVDDDADDYVDDDADDDADDDSDDRFPGCLRAPCKLFSNVAIH